MLLLRAIGSELQLGSILLSLIRNLAMTSGTSPWIGTITEVTGQLTYRCELPRTRRLLSNTNITVFFSQGFKSVKCLVHGRAPVITDLLLFFSPWRSRSGVPCLPLFSGSLSASAGR